MIQLYQGDCLVEMQKIADKSVDMILTDIPYGEVNRPSGGLRSLDKSVADIFDMDMNRLIGEFMWITKQSFYIFCGIGQVSAIRNILQWGGVSTRLLIWEKTNPSPMNGDKIWLSGIECCVFGKYPKATFKEHCKNSVLRFSSTRNKLHPTQKPVRMLEYMLTVSSNNGDLICDPFMGSGSTGVACVNTNRNFIGIELNDEYFNIASERIKKAEEDKAGRLF